VADQAPNSSIFGSDQSQPQNQSTTQQNSTTPDSQVAILVGEGRKYKTIEDLAKAYINLDGFTEKLKGENAEFREKLAGAKTIDDVLQRLTASQDASTQDQGADKGKSLTADEIAKIVRSQITGLETEKSRRENMLKADAAMKKQFGEKAGEVFSQAAATPEKKQALMQLASVDPDAFVKLFVPAAAAQGTTQTDSGSTVNTAALGDITQSSRVNDPGTKDFYDALRKKEPRKYYSQEIQLAMHKAAQANPEKYFGRKLGT
jgi:hypothetical protein